MTDIAIRNARVLDGTGNPAIEADIGIEGDRITQVGNVGSAQQEIDANGLHVSPGFIDTHSHDDGAFFRHPGMEFNRS